MNASNTLAGIGFSFATLLVLAGCASSGQRPAASDATSTAQTGTTGPRRNPFVLTAAEIAAAPNIMNAEDAVRTLRPHFLRVRGSTTNVARGPLTSGSGRTSTGRRSGQGQSGQPSGSEPSTGEEDSQRARAPGPPEDPGIVVYIDRQRYGSVQSLREIPVATIEEIRFLNVGEANSQFGMGHPHGVIQIISKRGSAPR